MNTKYIMQRENETLKVLTQYQFFNYTAGHNTFKPLTFGFNKVIKNSINPGES